MSDHLIAEANRHAMVLPTTQPTHADIVWYVREVYELRAELELLREWQREVIQNANVHHAEREDAIARAERAEAELKEWSLLNLWGGTPEIIHAFIKGQQSRIYAAQDAEAELATEREKVRVLREACSHLSYVPRIQRALHKTEEPPPRV